jgi:hypothetical protein
MNTSSKNDWVTIASVALFILLSIGIVVFFYNQNMELKKVIANYQKATITPSSTPVTTIQVSTPSATPIFKKTQPATATVSASMLPIIR